MMLPADRRLRLRTRFAGAFAIVATLVLTACEGADPGQGGVSEGEARALDEAAERLDKQQLPEDALPPLDLPVAETAPAADFPSKAADDRSE